MNSLDERPAASGTRSDTLIWMPEDVDPIGWVSQATALPIETNLPEEPAARLVVMWPSACSFVARGFASGTMPTIALEKWLDYAEQLEILTDKEFEVVLLDYDAALADPLLILETLGFDESLALHATDAPAAPTGLPALIAAEAVAADANAELLDAKLFRLTKGRDAPLDVDELAQGYTEALSQGNLNEVDQLRDRLLDRQIQRHSIWGARAGAAGTRPPLFLATPTNPSATIKPVSRSELAQAVAEVHRLQRALAARERSVARTQARVHRLEGLLTALIADLSRDADPAPHSPGFGSQFQNGGQTAQSSASAGAANKTPPQSPQPGQYYGGQNGQPGAQGQPPHDATSRAAPANFMSNGFIPNGAMASPQTATPTRSMVPMPTPTETSSGPAAPHAQGAPVPFQPLIQPPQSAHSGNGAYGHPNAPTPAAAPATSFIRHPAPAPMYGQASLPPIHAHATPDNPLALAPERSAHELGPDRDRSGGSSPPKKGGLLARLRGR